MTLYLQVYNVNIYSNIQIPGPASFQGGGGIIQKGGAPTDDDRDSQNKMIQICITMLLVLLHQE